MAISSLAPHPFTLRQLQYALSISESLSFRKAAEQCRVSQPSLSAQIAALEEALGVRLFERDRRRVLVTAPGKQILERARRIMVEADDLTLVARHAGDPLAGTLRIGVIPTISPYLLPSTTPLLRRTFPNLTTVWIEDKTPSLSRALEDGSIDAALLAMVPELGEVDHEVVAQDPFVLVTRTGDPLGSNASPAKPSELRNAEFLLLDDGHCFRDQALSYCTQARGRELEFRATSLTTLAQMVAGGAGVTLLPQLAVHTEVHRARLKVRPLAKPTPSRTIALVWRKRSPLADALKRIALAISAAYPSNDPKVRSATRTPVASDQSTTR